jgi:inhibitor of KinA sporulation pathway (predicted exonuclease)
MIFLSLDLEMAQPSGKIIEVGYCVGDTHAPVGEVMHKASYFVDPREPLSQEIIDLTGITDAMIAENNHPLWYAHEAMVTHAQGFGCSRNLITWGSNDGDCLRTQMGNPANFWFAPIVHDVKKVYQFVRQAKGLGTQSGLAKSMVKLGLQFKGKKHRAMDDALNTLFVAQFLTQKLKELPIEFKK